MNIYENLKQALNLQWNPVGVKLIFDEEDSESTIEGFKVPDIPQRYCEYVKRASRGDYLRLKRGVFSCVTGEIMLGLKEPERIEFKNRLSYPNLKNILLFPINLRDDLTIDSIILLVSPKNCMDIAEAYSKVFERSITLEIESYSGVCRDVTALVIKKKHINFSFLCVGARIFAKYDDCELLCGVPNNMVHDLFKTIISLMKEREADMELIKQLENYL